MILGDVFPILFLQLTQVPQIYDSYLCVWVGYLYQLISRAFHLLFIQK